MKNKWLVIAVLFPLLSFPQDKTATPRVNTTASAGLIAGESTAKPLLQIGAGLKFSRWYTGIGVGLDPYKFKSIPLFADGRLTFGKNDVGFIYANGGYNFPYDNPIGDDDIWKTDESFSGGFYMDAGIGCRIPLKSSWHRILFSAGYSQKEIVNTVEYTYPCVSPPCNPEINKNQYRLGRIVAKMSWVFGR